MSKITFTTQEYYAGETIVPPATTPTKSGYTFREWIGFPANMIMPAENITVTAVFDEDEVIYTITYVVDGTTYTTQSYNAGNTITPPADPTKKYYQFSEWSNMPQDMKMPANNLTVTAVFTESVITFNNDNIKNVCVTNWGSNGQITEREAAAVTTFLVDSKNPFYGVTSYGSFDEIKYFTGVTSIGYGDNSNSFNGLSYMTIPDHITNIGGYCFGVRTSTLASFVLHFETPRTNNLNIKQNAFRGTWNNQTACERAIRGNLPEKVTSIGSYAFADDELTGTFVVPSTVTNIGSYVWYKSKSSKNQTLDYIKFLGTTPPTVNAKAFISSVSNQNSMIHVLIPASALSAYQSAWSNLFSNSNFNYSTY